MAWEKCRPVWDGSIRARRNAAMRVFRMMAMAWGEVPVRKVEAVLSEGRVAGGAFFDGAPVSAQDLLPATGRTGRMATRAGSFWTINGAGTVIISRGRARPVARTTIPACLYQNHQNVT